MSDRAWNVGAVTLGVGGSLVEIGFNSGWRVVAAILALWAFGGVLLLMAVWTDRRLRREE